MEVEYFVEQTDDTGTEYLNTNIDLVTEEQFVVCKSNKSSRVRNRNEMMGA